MKSKLSLVKQICLLTCLFLLNNVAIASFHKNLWPKWEAHNPISTDTISHQEWQDFLTRRVITNDEEINLIDYPQMTKADINGLEHYITHLSQINISAYNRNEQLAYWLNLYNAVVVKIVAGYYPIDTVRDVNISPGLFNVGPWGANIVTIAGTQLSLDDIQNRIIRAIWNDPRTHYAVNDGTIGSANLSKNVYQGSIIDQQLNQAAFRYINSLRGIQVIDGKLVVSKIYGWYLDDFGGNESDVINHLSFFAKEPLRTQLKKINSITSYIYNWHLNTTIATSS